MNKIKRYIYILFRPIFEFFETNQRFRQMRFELSRADKILLANTKDGKHSLRIAGDTILRSENQDGMEFTYSFWICIIDLQHNQGEWKHIMHKGSPTSYPNRAPGVWLHPVKNSIRVYMNTFKNIGEFADLHNIPLGKWFHVAICCKQRNLDIYMNGNLAKRHVLSGLPNIFWLFL